MKTSAKLCLILSLYLLFTPNSWGYLRDNETCGIEPGKPLTNAYGPWDFTNPKHQTKIPRVLQAHFTPSVERLIKGKSGSVASDIDYTLRAVPNYHRALSAMSKYERIKRSKNVHNTKFWTAECYFKRAIYFTPKDATTRVLFAIHLHLSDKHEQAEQAYIQSLELAPENAEIHYNLGLLYVDMGQIEKASVHSDKAYKLGYPLAGLKNKIAKAKNRS